MVTFVAAPLMFVDYVQVNTGFTVGVTQRLV